MNDLLRRRRAMMCKPISIPSDLPPGYRRAQYIWTERSAARLVIPLDYFATQTNDVITIELLFSNFIYDGTCCGYDSSIPFDGRFQVYVPNGKLTYWGKVRGISPAAGTEIITDTVYTIQAYCIATLSGIRICGYGNNINYGFYGNIYSFSITRDGTKVLDLVPCTNPSKIAGMYDMIGGGFFSSESSVQFGYQY